MRGELGGPSGSSGPAGAEVLAKQPVIATILASIHSIDYSGSICAPVGQVIGFPGGALPTSSSGAASAATARHLPSAGLLTRLGMLGPDRTVSERQTDSTIT